LKLLSSMPPVSLTMHALKSIGATLGSALAEADGDAGSDSAGWLAAEGLGEVPPVQAAKNRAAVATSAASLRVVPNGVLLLVLPDSREPSASHRAGM
jgi:hypothetical protein